MKIAIWMCFLAVALTSLAACGWLWVSPDIVRAAFGSRPIPTITQWAFASQPWLPLGSLPWLAAAFAITFRRSPVNPTNFHIYIASAFLGCVFIAAFALVPSILPFKVLIIGMAPR